MGLVVFVHVYKPRGIHWVPCEFLEEDPCLQSMETRVSMQDTAMLGIRDVSRR